MDGKNISPFVALALLLVAHGLGPDLMLEYLGRDPELLSMRILFPKLCVMYILFTGYTRSYQSVAETR